MYNPYSPHSPTDLMGGVRSYTFKAFFGGGRLFGVFCRLISFMCRNSPSITIGKRSACALPEVHVQIVGPYRYATDLGL